MQHLLEGTDVGTLFLDEELRVRKFTPRIASVFRVKPQDVGRSIFDFGTSLDRDHLREELQAALDEGRVTEGEVSDRDGTTYFLRILPYRPLEPEPAEPVVGVHVPPTGIQGVVLSLTDISALDEARASAERLLSAVRASEDAIFSMSLDGAITSWNPGAERLYGFTEEEIAGRNIRALVPRERLEEVEDVTRTVARGTPLEGLDLLRLGRDGTLLDTSVSVSPIRNRRGEVVAASVVARDVAALTRARRDLEERESRIRLILDSAAEGIFGLDRSGRISFCNAACVRKLGYERPEALVGRELGILLPEPAPEGPPHRILAALAEGRAQHADDEDFATAEGELMAVEWWSHPVRKDGQIDGAVVTFIDVSERRRAEAALRTEVERREAFLAMLSHELRNPLSAILTATKVLGSDTSDPSSSMRARDVVTRQAQHMARLLDDLLDVSRITQGTISIERKDFDLRDALNMALEAIQPEFDALGLRLDVELPEAPMPVSGDPARFQQVFGNLLSNAARYAPAGSRAVVRGRLEDDQAVVEVEDEGDGIDPDMLEEIFELFVQTEQGIARSRGGLGVGLALVRRLVELHGGTVRAKSDGPGTGSTFEVRVPRKGAARRAASARAAAAPAARRIVLVEDQDDAREMLELLLRADGHQVSSAADGRAGLELIAQERPDVALVDIGLPGLDGFAVARAVRERSLGDVFLVALTGYGTREDVEATRDAGFDAHLTKPARPEALRTVLEGR
jgi:two-component system CheB/CheR fusion protein